MIRVSKYRASVFLAAAVVFLPPAAAHADSCATSSNRTIDATHPVTLTGRFRRGTETHPGRGTFVYYFLELPSPTCIANVPEYGLAWKNGPLRRDYDGVTRLQIPKPRGAQVGQTITVTGTIFMGMTVWYVEDLSLMW